jgi:hypothetical protein
MHVVTLSIGSPLRSIERLILWDLNSPKIAGLKLIEVLLNHLPKISPKSPKTQNVINYVPVPSHLGPSYT